MQGRFALAMRRFAAVQQKYVEPVVAVKVEKADATTHGFDQITVRGKSVKVPPGNTRFGGDIGEDWFRVSDCSDVGI
jgi:hypothetical protein